MLCTSLYSFESYIQKSYDKKLNTNTMYMFLHLSLVSAKTLGVLATFGLIEVKKEYYFMGETMNMWLNYAVTYLMGYIISSIVTSQKESKLDDASYDDGVGEGLNGAIVSSFVIYPKLKEKDEEETSLLELPISV